MSISADVALRADICIEPALLRPRRLVWLNTYIGQFIPIAGLIGLRLVVGAGSWLFSKFGKKKLTVMEEMAEQVNLINMTHALHSFAYTT